MKFSQLIEKIRTRGVIVAEMRSQSDPEILGVCEDSRKARPGDLFIARTGTKTTGTQFIDEAFAKGAVAAVMQEDAGLPCAIAWARVANVNLACALLAHELAGNPTAGMKMIGITGTKGKTTVAYLLRSVLKAAGHKVGMIGTVEIDDGVATVPADMTTPGSVELALLFSRMQQNGVTHCVMEVSSHALHQHRTAGIDFAVAIFTNLTGDHLDYHKTMEEYAAAKAMLFEGLREDAVAIVNVDDSWAQELVQDCKAHIRPFGISLGDETNSASESVPIEPVYGGWTGTIAKMTATGMRLIIHGQVNPPPKDCTVLILRVPLVGKHNAYNVLAVTAAAWELQVWESVNELQTAVGAPGRLQAVSISGSKPKDARLHVFVDYAHTHDSLENVLSALRTTMTSSPQSKIENQKSKIPPRLICLFGCGGDRDRTKRPKMAAIAERLADKVIVTSDNPRTENPAAIIEEICTGFSPNWKSENKITVEPDRRTAIRAAIAIAHPGDVVLLAGKGHENYQIIGTTKHHFDDVEEAQTALRELNLNHQDTKTPR